MDEHQKAAYVALFEAAEKVRAIITSARSSTHPLAVGPDTLEAMGNAMNWLHTAQRGLEWE